MDEANYSYNQAQKRYKYNIKINLSSFFGQKK